MAMSMSDRGRLGGKATVARHGTAHMSAIGKLGFAAYARRLGFKGGGRVGAASVLIRRGKMRALITPAEAERSEADFEQMFNEMTDGADIPS